MLLSREELEKMAVMHLEVAEFMAKNPRPQTGTPTFEDTRRVMIMAEKGMNANVKMTSSETLLSHDIPMRDGFMSSIKIQKPSSAPPGPLIVLFFGGGYVGGTNEQLLYIGIVLVRLLGATVVSPSYRLGPEHKFPASQHDAWDSMKWIAENATGPLLNADPKQGFIPGGVSAGGGLTACLSRVFQEEPLAHPLTGQWLCIPGLMDSSCVPDEYKDYYIATEQMADGPFFSQKQREGLQKAVQADSKSPLRNAILSKTDIANQPRTYFQVDGMDPLRDDALIYHEMLTKAGVSTKVDLYPGCPHGHVTMPGLEVTDAANIDTIVGFGWLLGKEVSREDAARELGVPNVKSQSWVRN